MALIVLWIIILSAVFGVIIGIVLRMNAVTPYSLGNHFARHYLNDNGVETEDDSKKRWDD